MRLNRAKSIRVDFKSLDNAGLWLFLSELIIILTLFCIVFIEKNYANRNAVILVSIFAILGAMLQGQQVMIPNNFYALNSSKIFSNML